MITNALKRKEVKPTFQGLTWPSRLSSKRRFRKEWILNSKYFIHFMSNLNTSSLYRVLMDEKNEGSLLLKLP